MNNNIWHATDLDALTESLANDLESFPKEYWNQVIRLYFDYITYGHEDIVIERKLLYEAMLWAKKKRTRT